MESGLADMPPEYALLFAVIWCLGFIGGVSPMFLTSGSQLKMTVLVFYSFSISGAVGGMASVRIMRSLSGTNAPLT